MSDGIWIVDHNHTIRYIPLIRPLTRRRRLVAWLKSAWRRLLIWLAVLALLAGCTPPPPAWPGAQRPGPQNPGVLVDDDGHCRFTRSAMLDRPVVTVWGAGCR